MVSTVQHYEKYVDGLCTHLWRPLVKRWSRDMTVDQCAFMELGWHIKTNDLKVGEQIGKGEFSGTTNLKFSRKIC